MARGSRVAEPHQGRDHEEHDPGEVTPARADERCQPLMPNTPAMRRACVTCGSPGDCAKTTIKDASAEPGDARNVPREAQGLPRELGTTEELRQVGPPEEAHEDVALAQVRMGCREQRCQNGRDQQRDAHAIWSRQPRSWLLSVRDSPSWSVEHRG